MKLIKINTDHYVVVDDSEIKEGDYYFSKISDNVFRRSKDGHWIENYDKKMYQKITHSTQPLEYDEDNTYTYGKVKYVPLSYIKELIGEVDVEKMGYNESFRRDVLYNQHSTIGEQNAFIDGTKYGYSQAIEDNKEKKYTEEDLRKVFLSGVKWDTYKEDEPEYKMDMEEVFSKTIQSLQSKTEWKVEIVDGKLKLK